MLRQLWHQPDILSPRLPSPARPLPPLVFVRNVRARRYILRVVRNGVVRVTIPRGGSEAFARGFAAEKRDWIRTQLDRLAAEPLRPLTWGPGSFVWFRGTPWPLEAADNACRLGPLLIPLPSTVSPDWRHPVERHLRRLAETELPPLVRNAASRLGLPVGRVTVRNQRTRWGSCSRRRTISLNWRLVQTPVEVRDYLIAHELAHLREMNHSGRFWRVVASYFPRWREAEAWLRRHGRELIH